MENIQKIKLFIACPGDILEEIESIKLIIEEINKITGNQNGYVIEILNWKLDTYTQIGKDAQDVINSQLESDWDILLGILWQKVGTPTLRDKSGTIEEINRALANDAKESLIYFKTSPPENLNLLDLSELSGLYAFKKDLSQRGVLYKEFNSIREFESMLRMNLTKIISDRLLARQTANQKYTVVKTENEKYVEIENILSQVDNRELEVTNEIDVFELVEKILSSLSIVTAAFESMTLTANQLSSNLSNRTNELNKIINIKDNRLRLNKIQIIANLLAGELEEFNIKINAELPSFSEHLLYIGPNYSKLMLFARSYNIPEAERLEPSLRGFRDSTEGATRNAADLLKIVIEWPAMSVLFNKSKHNTIEVLKNLTREMLQGLKLMDEALQS